VSIRVGLINSRPSGRLFSGKLAANHRHFIQWAHGASTMSQDIKELKARAEALFRPPPDESLRHVLGEYEAHVAEKTMRLRALRLAKEAAQSKRSDDSKNAPIRAR
jgi:hypothetical protein